MPSFPHEALVALFRNRPELAAELLHESLHVAVPEYSEARVEDSDLTLLQPTQFTADLVVLLRRGEPVLVIVVEAQLSVDPDKTFSWPLYAAATRARYRCPSQVLVVTPSARVAYWALQPVDVGGHAWAPRVVGPDRIPVVTDAGLAVRDPELAVLSALAHGDDPAYGVDVALAALAGAAGLDDRRAALYHDVVLGTLGAATRVALEKLMATGYVFQTEFAKKHQAIGRAEGKAEGKAEGRAEGKAEGRAEGEANGILRVLEARGLHVTESQRAQILASKDHEQLDRWLVRAVTAESTAAVLADEP